MLKGTKSRGGGWRHYFKQRKKGDIVTIDTVNTNSYFVKKEGCYESGGILDESDVCPVSWKARYEGGIK